MSEKIGESELFDDFNYYEARLALTTNEFYLMTSIIDLTKIAPISMGQYTKLKELCEKVKAWKKRE